MKLFLIEMKLCCRNFAPQTNQKTTNEKDLGYDYRANSLVFDNCFWIKCRQRVGLEIDNPHIKENQG